MPNDDQDELGTLPSQTKGDIAPPGSRLSFGL
jgi:hypothetical protein